MKQLINILFYIAFSTFVVIVTFLTLQNIQPINHTHNKELEKMLIDTKWITNKYYNDEFKEVTLIFNKDHTIDFTYSNNEPADLYYRACDKWNWSKDKRIINVECSNKNYTKSTIEIIKITKNTLKIKTYSEYLTLTKK